jgi:hypothetical protein
MSLGLGWLVNRGELEHAASRNAAPTAAICGRSLVRLVSIAFPSLPGVVR